MTEYLPDWIHEGIRTKEFLKWLEGNGESIGAFSEWTILKGTVQNCVLIYGVEFNKTEGTDQLHFLRLYGIFRKTDRTLYEVSPVLYQAVGIPEEFHFPNKETVQSEIEEKVMARGKKLIDEDWDQLIIRSGCTREQLIPAINREQIRKTSIRYFQMGKNSKDIVYFPRFSFETVRGGFPDKIFLQYLNDDVQTVAEVTRGWLKACLPEISMKKIFYGCVREEMADMERNTKNSMNVQSAVRKTA